MIGACAKDTRAPRGRGCGFAGSTGEKRNGGRKRDEKETPSSGVDYFSYNIVHTYVCHPRQSQQAGPVASPASRSPVTRSPQPVSNSHTLNTYSYICTVTSVCEQVCVVVSRPSLVCSGTHKSMYCTLYLSRSQCPSSPLVTTKCPYPPLSSRGSPTRGSGRGLPSPQRSTSCGGWLSLSPSSHDSGESISLTTSCESTAHNTLLYI